MKYAQGIADSLISGKFPIQWPERALGPCPTLKQIKTVCWLQFAAILILFFVVDGPKIRNKTGVYSDYHCDFIYLYGDGHIFNAYPATRLYDYSLQTQVFNGINPPVGKVSYGPSPYPPFVAMFFGPFARLPFSPAYCLWLAASLCLYVAGVRFALVTAFPTDRLMRSLILCFSVAYFPFLVHTLANGQLATVGVFFVGLTIFLEDRSKPLLGGLALSLLTYKPTLLIVIVPMLLLTRRFRMLYGFTLGSAALAAVSTAVDGLAIWPAYIHFIGIFGKLVGLKGNSQLNLAVYMDLSSISHAIKGGRSTVGLTLLMAAISVVVVIFSWLLWKSCRGGKPVVCLVWAATLTWTLLLNVYVPIYDTILVAIAIALVLGALKDLGWHAATGWISLLSLAIFFMSWKTVQIAERFRGVQVLSILLFILGSAEFYFLYRAIRLGKALDTGQDLTLNETVPLLPIENEHAEICARSFDSRNGETSQLSQHNVRMGNI